MKELLYIGPNNPREKVSVKERNVKDFLATGLYVEVSDNILKSDSRKKINVKEGVKEEDGKPNKFKK